MSKSSSYKVIIPPNSLSEKVTWNQADNIELIEKRAAKWMRVAQDEAQTHLIEDVRQFDQIVREIAGIKPIPSDQLLKVLRFANDIRTQAAVFQFDELTTIASAVCEFVDRSPKTAAVRVDALLAFSEAMKAVVAHADGGGTGRTDKELADAAVKMLKIVTRP